MAYRKPAQSAPAAPAPEPFEPEAEGEHLDAEDRGHAAEKTSLHAQVIYEMIRREGERELARPTSALFWSGLAAGMSMGFSLIAEGMLHALLPDAPWRPLVSKLGYAVGFIIVILGSQQLFTENTLRPVIPLLRNRSMRTLRDVGRLWAAVLVANLLGALLFVLLVNWEGMFDAQAHAAFEEIGRHAYAGSFATQFLQGIFAGYLIALMLWLLPEAQAAKVIVITILAYLIGISGLPHIVAGSLEVLYLVVTGRTSIMGYLLDFMVPTLLGNMVGGVLLVAGLNHAQVTAGRPQEGEVHARA